MYQQQDISSHPILWEMSCDFQQKDGGFLKVIEAFSSCSASRALSIPGAAIICSWSFDENKVLYSLFFCTYNWRFNILFIYFMFLNLGHNLFGVIYFRPEKSSFVLTFADKMDWELMKFGIATGSWCKINNHSNLNIALA